MVLACAASACGSVVGWGREDGERFDLGVAGVCGGCGQFAAQFVVAGGGVGGGDLADRPRGGQLVDASIKLSQASR